LELINLIPIQNYSHGRRFHNWFKCIITKCFAKITKDKTVWKTWRIQLQFFIINALFISLFAIICALNLQKLLMNYLNLRL